LSYTALCSGQRAPTRAWHSAMPEGVCGVRHSQPGQKERRRAMAMVGKAAPDFAAKAYFQGKAQEVKLSDHRGKWVVLCFYPADFTCV